MPPCTMPNSALALPSCAAFERFAQRSESRIDSAASSRVDGYAVHSSNTMTMSESSTRWMRIDSSGVRKSLSPLMGDWNATPSSLILRSAPRLQTWKPPESVRIGRLQPMKRCNPPCAAITSSPGLSHR
jgi:hypothetical protein